jgi:hypothetical protein
MDGLDLTAADGGAEAYLRDNDEEQAALSPAEAERLRGHHGPVLKNPITGEIDEEATAKLHGGEDRMGVEEMRDDGGSAFDQDKDEL